LNPHLSLENYIIKLSFERNLYLSVWISFVIQHPNHVQSHISTPLNYICTLFRNHPYLFHNHPHPKVISFWTSYINYFEYWLRFIVFCSSLLTSQIFLNIILTHQINNCILTVYVSWSLFVLIIECNSNVYSPPSAIHYQSVKIVKILLFKSSFMTGKIIVVINFNDNVYSPTPVVHYQWLKYFMISNVLNYDSHIGKIWIW